MMLDPDPGNVREARQFVERSLAASEFVDLTDLVVLLTSELVTNAFTHAASRVAVQVEIHPDGVRIEVSDWGAGVPKVLAMEPLTGGGRGMALVDTLANDWGVRHDGDSKSVWFRLGH